jgi:hypothetical protein
MKLTELQKLAQQVPDLQGLELQADGWEAAVIGNTMLLTQLKRATDVQDASP